MALLSPEQRVSINLNKLLKPQGNRGGNSQKGRRRNGNRQRDRREVIAAPPSLDATVMCTKRFRFSLTAASSVTVTAAQVLAFLAMSLSGAITDVLPIIDRFRVELVELYGPMASDLEPVTVSLEWIASASGFSVPSKKRSDTSMSSTCCAFVSHRPDHESLSGEWMSGTTGPLFVASGPSNTVMDIVILFALNDGSNIPGTDVNGFIGTQAPTGFTPIGWKSV